MGLRDQQTGCKRAKNALCGPTPLCVAFIHLKEFGGKRQIVLGQTQLRTQVGAHLHQLWRQVVATALQAANLCCQPAGLLLLAAQFEDEWVALRGEGDPLSLNQGLSGARRADPVTELLLRLHARKAGGRQVRHETPVLVRT